MERESSLIQFFSYCIIFDRDTYQMDLWEVVEEDYEVPPLRANPTVSQIKA